MLKLLYVFVVPLFPTDILFFTFLSSSNLEGEEEHVIRHRVD